MANEEMHPTGLNHGASPDVRDEIAPGRVYNTPPSKPTADAPTSPAEQRIKELNLPDSPLWKTGSPEGDKARDELRRLLAEAASDAEKQDVADRSIHLLREQYNSITARYSSRCRRRGTSTRRGLLATFAQNGVAPAAVTEVMEFYVSNFNSALGKVSNVDFAAMEAGARAIFKKHGVAPEVVDAVIEYEKQRLGLA